MHTASMHTARTEFGEVISEIVACCDFNRIEGGRNCCSTRGEACDFNRFKILGFWVVFFWKMTSRKAAAKREDGVVFRLWIIQHMFK